MSKVDELIKICSDYPPSEELKKLVEHFEDFKIIDADTNYVYLINPNLGVVEGRVIKGSLGSYAYKFVVEKPGERSKLFSGKNAMKKIRAYLEGVI